VYELIVLGLIPGTHLQISFSFWITLLSILGSICGILLSYRTHRFRAWYISLNLLWMSRKATYPHSLA